MIQLDLIGGGGSGLGNLPDLAPRGAEFWPWIIAHHAAPSGGIFLRGACGLTANPPECGPTVDAASYKPEVGTPATAAADGLGWLSETFADAWGPWIASTGREVIAYIGPVPASEANTSTRVLFDRYVWPFARAGAIVAMDSLLAMKAGSPSHRLARYCRIYRGLRLWGESAEQIGQAFWLSELGGVICQTNGLDALNSAADRMKGIYADPDRWMIQRDITGRGLRAIGTIAIDDKARRLAVVDQVRARGWEPCTFVYDLSPSEAA